MNLVVILLIVILLGGGFGYWGHTNWGGPGAFGGLGAVLVIVLVLYALGVLR